MLATRLRKVLTAVVVLLLVAFAAPVLTAGTAGADSTDPSGYLTYAVVSDHINITGCTALCADASVSIPSTIEGLPVTSVAATSNFVTNDVHIAQLTIPNSVTRFGGIWQGNVNITGIVFAPGSKITSFDPFQFANNGNLRSIVMPDHLRTISGYAFYNAGLDSVTIPNTVTTIEGDSFPANRFSTVTIPASVTSLSPSAFSGNVLKTLADPVVSSVTYDLNGGSMPGGASAPTQADTLQNTTFTVGNGTEPVKGGYLFGGWSDGSAAYADGSLYPMGGSPVTLSAVWLTVTWSYSISNGQVTVSGCTPSCPDAALTIPSVIEGLPVTSVTSGGFSGVHIAQLTIPNSVTSFNDIWQGGYNITRIVFAPGSKITCLRGFLFANNGNLRSIVMPDHLRTISGYAFYSAGLDSVTIPNTVTTIEGVSFWYNNFSTVTIPASVTSLSSSAFSGNVLKTLADPVVSSVTYDLNGGSMPGGASAPTQADTLQNTTFTVGGATDPVRIGYRLSGWSDYWGTVYADGDSFLMGGIPETLTAAWAPTFDITYDLGGGAGTLPTHSPLTSGSRFDLASGGGLTREGYQFVGWSDSSATFDAGYSYEVVSSDVMLTAVWQRLYSVTYDLGGGAGTLPTHSPLTSGSRFDLASGGGLTREGYQFVGWSDSSATFDAGYSYEVVSSDVMLTAVWQRLYSVGYDLTAGDGAAPTQPSVAGGGSFQVASSSGLSYAGHTFVGWSDGTDLYMPGAFYTVRSANVTLTSVWSVNEAPIPDNVLPPGASASDLGAPTNITLSGIIDTTLMLGSNGTNASITIPAGALPVGTTVSVYPVLESAGIANALPSDQNFVVSLVVTWSAPDGSVPIAGSPLRMTIANSAIKSGDNVYQYVGGVLTLVGTATQDGTISFTFNEDPVFTVSTPDVTNGGDGGSGGTGGNSSGGVDETGDPADGYTDVVDATETASGVALPYTGSNVNTPLGIALVLFTLGGAMVLGTRRKKATLVRDEENELIS